MVICSWYTEFLWGAGGREGERRGVLSGAGRFQLPRELKLAGAGGWVFFFFLAVLGLPLGMQDLHLQHVNS